VTNPIVTYADAGSRLVARSLTNGITSAWSYDANARLSAINDQLGASVVRGVTYQRTPIGNKTVVGRPDLQKQWTYSYNRNSWITSESILRTDTDKNPLLASTTYDIDPVLNYRNITKTAQTVETSATTSQLTTINNRNQYSTFAGQPLKYDPNGNLTTKDGATIQYDFENHLKKATTADGTIIENTYDAKGRKVQEKTTSGATHSTEYVLRGDQVVEEYGDATMAARYVRGRGIDEIVRVETNGTTLFPIQDELANVERLTDSAGTTLERYEYQRYGEFRVFGGNAAERTNSAYSWRWLFQGREHGAVLNDTYDYRERTLWSSLARFSEEDADIRSGARSVGRSQALLGDWNGETDPFGRFEKAIHKDITEEALRSLGYVGPVSDGINNGHDVADALIDQTNSAQHFDNSAFQAGINLHQQFRTSFLTQADAAEAAVSLGRYLHGSQDFYAHSMYVEYRVYHSHKGVPTASLPLWNFTWPMDEDLEGLLSGKFTLVRGGACKFISSVCPAGGLPFHYGEQGVNKDSATSMEGREISPNGDSYYTIARSLAYRQTVKDLMALPPARLKWLNGKLVASYEASEAQRRSKTIERQMKQP
jgi:YD repeat-containing protein